MEDAVQLQTHIGLTRAREGIAGLMDKVAAGNLRVISRRKEAVALVPAEAMEHLLAQAYPFHPDLDDAQDALVSAVLDYVASWEEELRRAPSHAARFGWVYRVELAEQPDAIRRMIFANSEAPDVRRAPSFL